MPITIATTESERIEHAETGQIFAKVTCLQRHLADFYQEMKITKEVLKVLIDGDGGINATGKR